MSLHHVKPRGFALGEVSPFCAVEPLEDQEKQKKVWEIFNDVDGLRFYDALSIDPGDVNGSACREAPAYGCWPRSGCTHQPGGYLWCGWRWTKKILCGWHILHFGRSGLASPAYLVFR